MDKLGKCRPSFSESGEVDKLGIYRLTILYRECIYNYKWIRECSEMCGVALWGGPAEQNEVGAQKVSSCPKGGGQKRLRIQRGGA